MGSLGRLPRTATFAFLDQVTAERFENWIYLRQERRNANAECFAAMWQCLFKPAAGTC